MFNTVAGTTDLLPAVTVTTLSVILLVISLIMGLKFRWFRARIYNIQASKGSSEPTSSVGVYRGQSFEVASAAPPVRRLDNATASSSSNKFQPPSSSRQLPPPSSSDRKVKTDTKKKYPAPSTGNPPVGQSQPPGSKQYSIHKNKLNHQPTTNRNPLAQLDKSNERSRAENPPQSAGQNMRPQNEVPVPKGNLQRTKLPPIPVTNDDNSTRLKLTDDNRTSAALTNDNLASPTEIDDNTVFLKLGHGGSTALKSKTPKPLYITEQDESESET
jgi:hypothetical protein